MTKTSKLAEFFEENSRHIQQIYPGIQLAYLEDALISSELSLEEFILEVNSGRPIDYIAKCRHFAGYDFYVDERVLIPRFETELLFEMSLNEIQNIKEQKIKMIEVGVGSGCLGLSVLASSFKAIDFIATDISSEALEVFKINRDKLFSEFITKHKIQTVETDRLHSMSYGEYHLIISNPPYIKTESDKEKVHATTIKYEPHLALFIDDDTYEQWFSSFFEQVWNCLIDGGCFMMEGHEDHLQLQANNLSRDKWSHIEVKQDLTGRDRFLVLRK